MFSVFFEILELRNYDGFRDDGVVRRECWHGLHGHLNCDTYSDPVEHDRDWCGFAGSGFHGT